MEFTCIVCNMKFTEDVRLQRHLNTHKKKSDKGKKLTKFNSSDFDRPDFSQVM